jgi:hypothetical protein
MGVILKKPSPRKSIPVKKIALKSEPIEIPPPVLKTRYYWQALSEDGLLKDPSSNYHGYNRGATYLAKYGYDTREEALEDFKKYCTYVDNKGKTQTIQTELILIETHRFV